MLLNSTIQTKWNPRNKEYYIGKGYKFTEMGDTIDVLISDISPGSNTEVTVKCDYCGKEYTKKWYRYLQENNEAVIHKDCCINCRKKKIQESVLKTYGETTVLKLDEIKERISDTNIKKYGSVNPFSSDVVKNKIVSTNYSKYGVKSPMQCKDILDKMRATCRKRYGVDFYVQTQHFSGENSPVWKGGVARGRSERYTYDYIKWRTGVFSRDNYTCQCCGVKNGFGKTIILNGHHIFGWANNPEMRFDISNGITLCKDCHEKFHKMYGKKNVTNIELNNFLNNYGKKIC